MADFNPSTSEEYRNIQRRFWVRVKPAESGCWLWIGGVRANGYGMFAVQDGERWTQTTSHRFAYQDQVGPVPEGYEVDHLCRVRNCVRPEHLEATTVAENRRRRDAECVFDVPTYPAPLPVIPPKPAPPPKRDYLRFCLNGHEYAIVGKIRNGHDVQGQIKYTCAACTTIRRQRRRKGNAAKDRPHCPQGHPYSGDNLWVKTKWKNGRPYTARQCRTCISRRNIAAYHAKRAS